MKIKKQFQGITTESLSTPIKKNHVIDAVLIQSPDLGFYLKMQNLMNFFLDCLKQILAPVSSASIDFDNIKRCILHIEQLYKEHKSELNDEIQKIVPEFFDEVGQFQTLLNKYIIDEKAKTQNERADALLAAKSSRLQWLSVCLLEELKYPLSGFNKKNRSSQVEF